MVFVVVLLNKKAGSGLQPFPGYAAVEAAFMSIVNHLPCSAMVGEPFADYLNISVPIDSAGAYATTFFPFSPKSALLREFSTAWHFSPSSAVCAFGKIATESLGSVRFSRRGKVQVVSTSGDTSAAPGKGAVS